MPKSKKTTTVEETIDETPAIPEVNYKEDIENKSMEQVAKPEPEEKVEEKPVVEETPDDTEEIEFDPEQLKKDAAESARQSILDALSGRNGEETKENVDEYEAWALKIFQDTGKSPTWKEAAEFIKEGVKRDFTKDAADKAEADEKTRLQAQETEKTEMERVNTYVDSQMAELYASNKFTKITDEKNPNDPGIAARRALMEQTMKINKERIDKGLPTKTIKEVFYEDYKAPNRQPLGFDAPVSAGRNSSPTQSDDGQEINYMRDIKNDTALNRLFRRRG